MEQKFKINNISTVKSLGNKTLAGYQGIHFLITHIIIVLAIIYD